MRFMPIKSIEHQSIVFCADDMLLSVDSGLSLQGAAIVSDVFFPFRDGLDVVIDQGATCVIQPGGSMRNQEVIEAANERDVAMVFTGVRHLRTCLQNRQYRLSRR
jgi:AICAR transformylase/IMP cyclohydrolase PurH